MSQKKYLDLAGLTAYDRKLKEWFKAGVVDITDDAIRALFVTVAEGPADNEIWYTSSDGNIINPYRDDVFGFRDDLFVIILINNTYEDGKGVITFDGSVTSIGFNAFANCRSLTSVTIPNSVTNIGDYPFINCSSLTSITFEGTMEEWNSITKKEGWNGWNSGIPATYVQCSDGQVTL